MSNLTRFRHRSETSNGTKIAVDGAVSGAIQVIPFVSTVAVTNGADYLADLVMPAGMKFKITDAVINVGTVANTPIVSIGSTAAGTEIAKTTLAATSVAASQAMTIKSYDPAAAGTISVRITAAAGETIALPVSVTVVGHPYDAPTSVRQTSGSGTSNYR